MITMKTVDCVSSCLLNACTQNIQMLADIQNTTLVQPVRIGISPWKIAVRNCLSSTPHTKQCLKKPGIEIEVLLLLLGRYKLPWIIKVSSEPGCGFRTRIANRSEDGTGLFGMLIRNEIDITGNVCSFRNNRIQDFDFTPPVYIAQQIFVIKTPKPKMTMNSTSTQTNAPLWLGLFGVGIIVGLLITIIMRQPADMRSVMNGFFLAFEAYAFRTDLGCVPHYRKYLKLMLLLTAWTTCARILFVLYSNTFKIQILISSYNRLPFRNLGQLGKLAAHGKVNLINYRKKFPMPYVFDPDIKKMFEQADRKYGYVYSQTPYETIMQQSTKDYQKHPYVLSTLNTWFDLIDSSRMSYISDDKGFGNRYSFMLRRDSPFAELINQSTSSLSSLAIAVRQRYVNPSKSPLQSKTGISKEWSPLKLPIYVGPFTVILITWLTGVSVLCIEIICTNKQT